jgi:hypothetical protein
MKEYGYLGWGLVATGAALQFVESSDKAAAASNNTNFSATTLGAFIGPIETFLPISLGYTLVLLGGVIVTHCYLKKG